MRSHFADLEVINHPFSDKQKCLVTKDVTQMQSEGIHHQTYYEKICHRVELKTERLQEVAAKKFESTTMHINERP